MQAAAPAIATVTIKVIIIVTAGAFHTACRHFLFIGSGPASYGSNDFLHFFINLMICTCAAATAKTFAPCPQPISSLFTRAAVQSNSTEVCITRCWWSN
jgi:hypothetical protein